MASHAAWRWKVLSHLATKNIEYSYTEYHAYMGRGSYTGRVSYKALNYPKQKGTVEKKLPELCIISQHTPQTLTKPLWSLLRLIYCLMKRKCSQRKTGVEQQGGREGELRMLASLVSGLILWSQMEKWIEGLCLSIVSLPVFLGGLEWTPLVQGLAHPESVSPYFILCTPAWSGVLGKGPKDIISFWPLRG